MEKQRVHEQITKAAINLTQVKGIYTHGTGQTGWRAAPPVHDLIRRPRFFLRNEVFSVMPHVDEDPVRGFGRSAKPG